MTVLTRSTVVHCTLTLSGSSFSHYEPLTPGEERMNIRAGAVSVMVSGLVAVGGAAHASPDTIIRTNPEVDVDSATMFTSKQTISGGTTQSTDPTRFDYVAPSRKGATVASAMGSKTLKGWSYSMGGFTVKVPTLQLTHYLSGKGLRINRESASYQTSGLTRVCNYRTAFQNRFGSRIYSTRWAPLHRGCSWEYAQQNLNTSFTVQGGLQCARLYENGRYRGEQCHNVF